jgi:hypothetical protein
MPRVVTAYHNEIGDDKSEDELPPYGQKEYEEEIMAVATLTRTDEQIQQDR